jgi:4-hydroxy-3-methylbut-2-enyl diphosphate reductase
VNDIQDAWFENVQSVLITAGASAPESLVQDVCRYLTQTFGAVIDERNIRTEEVTFPLPKQLRGTGAQL